MTNNQKTVIFYGTLNSLGLLDTLLHELTHWFIHKFLGNNEKLHSEADKLLKYNYGIKYFKR